MVKMTITGGERDAGDLMETIITGGVETPVAFHCTTDGSDYT